MISEPDTVLTVGKHSMNEIHLCGQNQFFLMPQSGLGQVETLPRGAEHEVAWLILPHRAISCKYHNKVSETCLVSYIDIAITQGRSTKGLCLE